ncbi:MAG TPA: hypothetical protein VKA87_11515, partial [Nitrososphaeraceae archaeon]|nr:hypothetical protein [Nitrososphaeraceae archaeon]
ESKRDFSFTTTAREVIPIGHGFDNKRSSSISTCNPYWSTRCSVWGYSMVDFVILFWSHEQHELVLSHLACIFGNILLRFNTE